MLVKNGYDAEYQEQFELYQAARIKYIYNVKMKLTEDMECMIASGLAYEITGKYNKGSTGRCYVSLWRKYFNDQYIYYMNHGVSA